MSASATPPNRPAAIEASDRPVTISPRAGPRSGPAAVVAEEPSRTAEIGGTRVARRAGTMLATSVTSVPVSIATITVREATTVPVFGSSTPMAANSAVMPWAMPRPSTSPRTEATMPTTRPSTTTERMTWRREAPSVRRVANSRERWATVIESVLRITNAPTNSAMPPKPSRK